MNKLETMTDERRREIEKHASNQADCDLTGEPLLIVKGKQDPTWHNTQCVIVVGDKWEPQ